MDKNDTQKVLTASMLQSMEYCYENIQQLVQDKPRELLMELFKKYKVKDKDDFLALYQKNIKKNTMDTLRKVLENDETTIQRMKEFDLLLESRPRRCINGRCVNYGNKDLEQLNKATVEKLNEQLKDNIKDLDGKVANAEKDIKEQVKTLEQEYLDVLGQRTKLKKASQSKAVYSDLKKINK